ncbi:MAG TPA: hypothetical protein VNW23_01215, partial [Opitutaceae bacterium]|nr:hypothetical protein [Opitutaceae bacterium]
MLKRNLWKLILSAIIVIWAVTELLPLQDQPFTGYVRSHVTANPVEFDKLLDEAVARQKTSPS